MRSLGWRGGDVRAQDGDAAVVATREDLRDLGRSLSVEPVMSPTADGASGCIANAGGF
jgi:hypothetical protein